MPILCMIALNRDNPFKTLGRSYNDQVLFKYFCSLFWNAGMPTEVAPFMGPLKLDGHDRFALESDGSSRSPFRIGGLREEPLRIGGPETTLAPGSCVRRAPAGRGLCPSLPSLRERIKGRSGEGRQSPLHLPFPSHSAREP